VTGFAVLQALVVVYDLELRDMEALHGFRLPNDTVDQVAIEVDPHGQAGCQMLLRYDAAAFRRNLFDADRFVEVGYVLGVPRQR
jgi:hypothetical protein